MNLPNHLEPTPAQPSGIDAGPLSRRTFLGSIASVGVVGGFAAAGSVLNGQIPGERPSPTTEVKVLNPRHRLPVGWIIDDSTCLVNVNHFAVPQFAEAWGGKPYTHAWKEWPREIPDSFVRKFGEWCATEGVRGKYSIVPYPACVGRLDRQLPGWSAQELRDSLKLVRELMVPHWDIHPEMVTHTRVIDLKTGHPYTDHSLRFMENWEWTTGRSADEIASYMAYALEILKNVGLPCEGITTPGGFGNKALPQLAQATLESVRSVCKAEIPHYFRHAYDRGDQSVAPRVEYASGLTGTDPRCVVSIIACTGDWTGGWDNTPPGGVDKFISADLKSGRMVDILERGEPALMLAHWTGIYFNGQETGFGIFREVVRRLRARYQNLLWMKPSEVARYWAARELTTIAASATDIRFQAPFACPDFTVELPKRPGTLAQDGQLSKFETAASTAVLRPGTCVESNGRWIACFNLAKGSSALTYHPS